MTMKKHAHSAASATHGPRTPPLIYPTPAPDPATRATAHEPKARLSPGSARPGERPQDQTALSGPRLTAYRGS
ncbi:hypothetical protein Aglo01_07590 [Actinokineospora globicatena]|nr:hypothetical protein Aglo01_07590 [Actinokineospora globicatena]GLW83113.1 hypothetical protein Aglo02_07530 [Actinokineospora globicatena]